MRSLIACMVLLLSGTALGLSDSRDPHEPAPMSWLGPPQAPGARVEPAGVHVEIAATRRSVRVEASWRVQAPPGPVQLSVPSSLFQVGLWLDGKPTDAQVEQAPAPEPPAAQDVRIDPDSGRPYARAPLRQGPAVLYIHRFAGVVPPSGQLELRAAAVLSSGFDRKRRRRQVVEQTHLLHRRPDFFVYHFAARGPGGQITLGRPPNTVAQARMVDGVLRIAATARRPLPLAATFGLGLGLSGADGGEQALSHQGLLRASLDLLLPWGDALATSVDGGSDLAQHHHLTCALVYQLYSPSIPFTLVPLGGHLDVGPAVETWPTLRPGIRLGLGLHVGPMGLLLSADLFPEQAPSPEEGDAPQARRLRHRIGLLLSLGL
ncbi:MAG: hypothetical protein NZ890_12840 [Myxococcota bacterium]|nr:hypothetical protein [Myxococcota bacterium]